MFKIISYMHRCVFVNVDKSLLLVAEQKLISFGYTKTVCVGCFTLRVFRKM